MSQLAELDTLELGADGAQLFRRVLPAGEVKALQLALQAYDLGRPGVRLHDLRAFRAWLDIEGSVGQIAGRWLGEKAAPVRAILFDKNAASNWALTWHQDRTIAVTERADVSDFHNWNRKDGVNYVEPPFYLIERMLTVRIHLDTVSSGNAPLLVSPGTHRLGRLSEQAIPEVVERHGSIECLAEVGDVWAYRTAILHASKRAAEPLRRRVLQVDYSADKLPDPLRWLLASSR